MDIDSLRYKSPEQLGLVRKPLLDRLMAWCLRFRMSDESLDRWAFFIAFCLGPVILFKVIVPFIVWLFPLLFQLLGAL